MSWSYLQFICTAYMLVDMWACFQINLRSLLWETTFPLPFQIWLSVGCSHEKHLRSIFPSAKFITCLSILSQHILTITTPHTLTCYQYSCTPDTKYPFWKTPVLWKEKYKIQQHLHFACTSLLVLGRSRCNAIHKENVQSTLDPECCRQILCIFSPKI